jgi:hypothetical protein
MGNKSARPGGPAVPGAGGGAGGGGGAGAAATAGQHRTAGGGHAGVAGSGAHHDGAGGHTADGSGGGQHHGHTGAAAGPVVSNKGPNYIPGFDGEDDHASSQTVPRAIPARKAVLEDFYMLKTVGKGSFGKVVMVSAPGVGSVGGMRNARARARPNTSRPRAMVRGGTLSTPLPPLLPPSLHPDPRSARRTTTACTR